MPTLQRFLLHRGTIICSASIIIANSLCDLWFSPSFSCLASTLLSFIRLHISAEKLSSSTRILGFLAIALAMESLCFCPRQTFDPPCAVSFQIHLPFPRWDSGLYISAASDLLWCSSFVSKSIFESIVLENRIPFLRHWPDWSLSDFMLMSRISLPSSLMHPAVTSKNLIIRLAIIAAWETLCFRLSQWFHLDLPWSLYLIEHPHQSLHI